MSMTSVPGRALAKTPSSPSSTACTSGESGSMVITASAWPAASAALAAARPPGADQRLLTGRAPVVTDHVEPGPDQVGRHRGAHDAQPDEADRPYLRAHDSTHLSLSGRGTACHPARWLAEPGPARRGGLRRAAARVRQAAHLAGGEPQRARRPRSRPGGPGCRCRGWPARAGPAAASRPAGPARASRRGRAATASTASLVGGRSPRPRARARRSRRTARTRCPARRTGRSSSSVPPAGAPMPYRFCTQTTGAMARASASCAGVTPDRPRWRISPASRSSASAPKCSATESMPAWHAQVHHVEVVAAELAQVLLDLAAQLVGPGPGPPLPRRVAARPDLGRDDQVVRVGRERGVDQLVGRAQRGEVERGGVDVVDAELDRAAQHADRLVPVAGTASGISARPCWGRRIAPNPSRLTVRSPSGQVPAAAAGVTGRAVMDKEAPFLERAADEGGPGSGQAFVDKGEGELVEATGGWRRGRRAAAPGPASTASPCTVDQIGYSMPSRRSPAQHAGLDQLVERGAELAQRRAVRPGPVVRGAVGVPLRQRRTRWRTAPAPRARTPGTPVPIAPSRRRAAAGSPCVPRTRATPAAIRSASSPMAAAQTAARSSSRSAKCR